MLLPLKDFFARLQVIVKAESYFKYHVHWKYAITQIVYITSLIHWIEKKQLITINEIEIVLGLSGKSQSNSFCIELEDYLLGLCNLPSELSRLCVNSVTAGNYELPVQISAFVSDLYAGFRLLNLKNDNLRKRYDGIKYDMKKIEEVVYDISIRGWTKPQ